MPPLSRQSIGEVLSRVAERLSRDWSDAAPPVDLLIVGGAGGLLAGYLPPGRTTQDCDVMVWSPADARATDLWRQLDEIARSVADEFDLPPDWLNRGAGVFEHRLLPGWTERRIVLIEHGPVRFSSPSRVDYLALKLFAGRDVDLDDVLTMRITRDEAAFVRRTLESWDANHFAAHTVAGTLERLEAVVLAQEETPS
ncbi:MAG: hypothetical protein EA377_08755 [Phycisphaerales bacterium]|nr:MAG: hypothetical protein EA377_08755 [Phycisphaerales bacterium]